MAQVLQRIFRPASGKKPFHSFEVAPCERVYAIGDVHGRNDLLVAMLTKIVRDARTISDNRKIRLILLGDYIDRGDHSADVLDTLSAFGADGERRLDFLLGNHEAAMLAFLEDPIAGADWIGWGGKQTLTSYGIGPISRELNRLELVALRDELYMKAKKHLCFLQNLKPYAVSGDMVFAHASLDPALPLESQPDEALLWGRLPPGQASGLPGHRLVHGHFAADQPVTLPDRICVDTGAYHSGRLTCVRLDDAETFLTVDIQDLLP